MTDTGAPPLPLVDQVPADERASGATRSVLSLTPDDLDLVRTAVQTVGRAINREEFRTRLGVAPEPVDTLLTTLASRGAWEAAHPAVQGAEPGANVVALTEDELLLVTNALNEALHGLPGEDVPPPVRTPKAAALLNAIGAILDATTGVAAGATAENRYVDHLR